MPNTGNTQQQINYGAAANDGLGDPLRTAFIKTDENFDNIWLAGPVGSNITITNNTIQVNNTNGNLVLQTNGVGIIQTRGSLQSYANNVNSLGTANLRYLGGFFGPLGLDVTGNVTAGNISTGGFSAGELTATGLTVNGDAQITGNLRVQGDIIQVGNIVTDTLTIQLANTAANGSQANGAGVTVGANDDIATLLYNSSGNVWTTNIGLTAAGNISSGNLSVSSGGNTWQITGQNILAPSGGRWRSEFDSGDDFITSAVDGYINLQSLFASGNIASELHLEHGVAQIRVADGPFVEWTFRNTGLLEAPGDIDTPGDVTANSFIGDGSQLTGITVVAGSNTQVQFNDDGALGADPDFYFVKATNTLVVNGELNEHSIELGSQGFTDLNSNVIAQVTGNANSYTQINFQNINSGNRATTDYVATAAFGTDSTFFVNMGIAGNDYDNTNPQNSLGTSLYPQDSYLYSQGGNTLGGSGGNLVVGSNEPGGVVRIIADGSNDANIVATFSNTGIDVKGNILPVANNAQSLGNVDLQWAELWVANNTIYLGGVALGVTGNVLTVGGEPILSNDSDTSITTTGNITANAILTDNYFYANGQPFVSSSLGNLAVNDTRLEIATGATETSMFIGNGPAGLAMNQDSSSDAYLKLYANTTGSEFFNEGGDYSSGSYTSDGGSGGLITLNGAPNIELFLNNLNFPGTIVSVTINGTDTVPYDGAGWGGGTFNINTTTPPAVDPTVVSSIEFNIVYVNQFVLDNDEGDFGIYIGQENFEIESGRDVRIVAGDDFSIESNDGFDLRSRDTDVGGGIRLFTDYSNNQHTWLFRNDSALVLPQGGNIIGTTLNNSGSLQWVGSSSGDGYGYTTLVLRPDDTVSADQSIVIDPTAPNHIHIRAGGTQDNSGAQLYLGGEISHFSVGAGNAPPLYLKADNQQWTFGTDGVIYAPGNINAPGATFTGNVTADYFIGDGSQLTGISASYGNANVATFLADFGSNTISTTGNVTAGVLISSGSIFGNVDLILGNIANASGTKTRITTFGSNSYIQTGNGTVGSTGNIVFAPYLDATEKVVIDTATGNVTAANFTGNITITGNVTGTSANVELVAGSYEWTFDDTGNLTLPGNTFAVNYANGTQVDAVTRFESSWTVPTGNSTQSFTVNSGTYYLWVVGNIPNGIITWNATATITNTNVPVVGAQYAWVYDGAGTPIDFTSIPNQFVGTANTIVRSSVSPSITTNRFDFGINNTSGSPQTVQYGWIRIS